ncbi:hypothetical protein IWQ62_001001 [Dispira parvispora]|uniref:Protein kinase domain-containing protein n=1 Tax=Dispira parvispora TaxID=1520584 RepID=A0A9W8E8N4_9FUNG|nr:hypothetical protein IWQ62_001001 [Dispira parvispora]
MLPRSPSPSPPGTPAIPTTTTAAPVSVPAPSRNTSISRGFIGFARRNSARRTNSATSASPSLATSLGSPCPPPVGSSAPSATSTVSRPPPIVTKDLSQITPPIPGTTAPLPIRQTLRRSGNYSATSQGLGAAPASAPSRHLRTASAHSYALPPQVRVPGYTSLASPPDSTIVSPAMGFLSSFTSSSLGSSAQLLPDDEGQVVNQYVLGRVIGHGGFSVVREAVTMDPVTHSTQTFAMKIIRKDAGSDESSSDCIQSQLQREIMILKRLRNPYILKLHEVIETSFATFIVTEYCAQGTLLDYITRQGDSQGLDENTARSLFVQLALAMRYLHEQAGIAHQDLKLDNVLVDNNGNIKLADFGLSQPLIPLCSQCSNDGPVTSPTNEETCRECAIRFHSCVDTHAGGSLAYCSPEQLRTSHPLCSAASDIWSLGVILYALVMGTLPFQDEYEPRLVMKILNGQSHASYDHLSPPLRSLLNGMLETKPRARFSIQQVLRSDWCCE